jgi:hypothetical protein
MDNNKIIIISNSNPFTEVIKNKILQLVDNIILSNKKIIIFKEDVLLYDILKDNENVQYISSIASSGDEMLFNKENYLYYNNSDKIKEYKLDKSKIFKRAISRYPLPDRSKVYDNIEYKTLRESVVDKRIKFCISQIINDFGIIVNFSSNKDMNIINSIKPEYGDGKFYFIYDCIKNKSEFIVGGCYLKEEDFYKFIKENN